MPLSLWSGKRDSVMENWSTVQGTTEAKAPWGVAVLLPGNMLIQMGPICSAPILHLLPWMTTSVSIPTLTISPAELATYSTRPCVTFRGSYNRKEDVSECKLRL